MSEQCLRCKENPADYKKRQLCLTCYRWVYSHGLLNAFPNIHTITRDNAIKRYGENIISDLKDLVDNHHLTLCMVGEKHGVSRERIRQLFELLYGFKYTVAVNSKSETRKRIAHKKRIEKRNPNYKVENYVKGSLHHKGAESEKKVYDICSSLNYEIKPFEESIAIDLLINGFKCEIKSAYCTCLTSPTGRTPLYHFKRMRSQEDADFIICHAVPMNKFFVIPKQAFPLAGNLYLPSVKSKEWMTGRNKTVKMSHKSKYYEYEEAWHLLMPKDKEIVFNESKLAIQ